MVDVYGSRFSVPFSASLLPYFKGLDKTKVSKMCVVLSSALPSPLALTLCFYKS